VPGDTSGNWEGYIRRWNRCQERKRRLGRRRNEKSLFSKSQKRVTDVRKVMAD
jgi:hypothetical protein